MQAPLFAPTDPFILATVDVILEPDTCMSSPEFVLELSEELLESAV